MKEKHLIAYPRGFIGFATLGLNKETNERTLQNQLDEIKYNNRGVPAAQASNEVFSLNITKLHLDMLNHTIQIDKLKFNKAVIIEAFRNFSSHDLNDWIELQRKSRYFGINHQRFILDTLLFITTGRRETSLRTWEVILKASTIDDTQSIFSNDFNKKVSNYFKDVSFDNQVLGSSLRRVLSAWLSHRGGTEDLLKTLNILFGKYQTA